MSKFIKIIFLVILNFSLLFFILAKASEKKDWSHGSFDRFLIKSWDNQLLKL